MFERFTEDSRQVTVRAQSAVRNHRHEAVGTGHMLLGLIRHDETAAEVLAELGVTEQGVRDEVAERYPKAERPANGQIPFTPMAKKSLELALREALSLGHNYIGSEHILLGLIRDGKSTSAQIIAKLRSEHVGDSQEAVRNKVIRTLSGPAPHEGKRTSGERKWVRRDEPGSDAPAPVARPAGPMHVEVGGSGPMRLPNVSRRDVSHLEAKLAPLVEGNAEATEALAELVRIASKRG
jgi:ATP-dependent Clp protease ATP-binding subunit ClpA